MTVVALFISTLVKAVCRLSIPNTNNGERHSYATILRNSGAPTAFISESLGHSNIKTTASYLDSFETDTKKEWAKALVDVSSILQD